MDQAGTCGLPTARDRLARFRAGDPDVLSEVFRHYAPEIEGVLRFGFSFESSGRAHRFPGYAREVDVEDQLQEVFVRAFSPAAREGYDGVSEYGPYLRTIARNLVINERSAARVRREILVDGESPPEPPDDTASQLVSNVNDRYETAEIFTVATEFLNALSVDEQELLSRRFRLQQSQADVAVSLGLSRPTLRKRERALLARFYEHMQRNGYFEGRRPPGDRRAVRIHNAILVGALLELYLGGTL